MTEGRVQSYADLSVVCDRLQAVDEQLLVLRQGHEQQHGEGSGKQQQTLRHRSFICQTHTDHPNEMLRKIKKV